MADKRKIFNRIVAISVCIILASVLSFYFFFNKDSNTLPDEFVKGNGRLEATEVDIATKLAGRLAEVLVKEGDYVEKGQVVATLDTATLQAQLRQAQAETERLRQARLAALSRVEGVGLKLKLATKELERSKNLNTQGIVPQQQYERDQTAKESLGAEYSVAQSSVSEADAAIKAAIAQTERLNAEINDCSLKSPIKGFVLTRLAEPGEVLPYGGRVLTVVDRTDVYMNVYLSEKYAGIISIGGDAKVVLDAIPDRAFSARATYVSEKAQFTPKEVEAAEERQKLVFRVKVSLLEYNDPRLKPGMPGVVYIRSNPNIKWPEHF